MFSLFLVLFFALLTGLKTLYEQLNERMERNGKNGIIERVERVEEWRNNGEKKSAANSE